VDDQFMVGDRMMVAPLFAGEAGRKVVIPEGQWHDFWTGESVGGATERNVPAATENIPVYVKAGSIIPWAEVELHSDAPESGAWPFASMAKARCRLRSATGKIHCS
jgi:alpha-D-xyloside xylohydrolase